MLLRGGFAAGEVPGLPEGSWRVSVAAAAVIRLTWQGRQNRRYSTPTLARTAMQDRNRLEDDIRKQWLSHLLASVDSFDERAFALLDVRGSAFPKAGPWLEEFTAWPLYKLARSAWRRGLERFPESSLERWERSEDEVLPLHAVDHTLAFKSLWLLLPAVCRLESGEANRWFVAPPTEGWEEKFKNWSDFLRARVEWTPFVRFVGRLDDSWLFYRYAGKRVFNERYREEFSGFAEREILELSRLIEELLLAREMGRPATVSTSQIALLTRAREVAGDLTVATTGRRHVLGDLLPEA